MDSVGRAGAAGTTSARALLDWRKAEYTPILVTEMRLPLRGGNARAL
jgi:hypothetical protein